MNKIIAYRLEPVYENTDPNVLMTAAVMQCMATGEYLSGMGGGGEYLSPSVATSLRGGQHNPLRLLERVHETLADKGVVECGTELACCISEYIAKARSE